MPQAKITLNGTPGSNTDLPINTLVQLNNQNIGGETTYTWAILDQPPGAADSLSATNIQNPTLTPKKEGTYRVKLTVNQGTGSEVSDIQDVGIRLLKSRERLPAAGEQGETNARGWAEAMDTVDTGAKGWLPRIDQLYSVGLQVVGVAQAAMQSGQVIYPSGGLATIKSGLPGQEQLPFWSTTSGVAGSFTNVLGICLGTVGKPGVPPSSSPQANDVILVQLVGPVLNLTGTGLPGWPFVQGQVLYMGDGGAISATPTTFAPGADQPQIGHVISVSGGSFAMWFDGTLWPGRTDAGSINWHVGQTKVHGTGATPTTTPILTQNGSGVMQVQSGDGTGATVTLQVLAKAGQSVNVFEVLGPTNARAFYTDKTGTVVGVGDPTSPVGTLAEIDFNTVVGGVNKVGRFGIGIDFSEFFSMSAPIGGGIYLYGLGGGGWKIDPATGALSGIAAALGVQNNAIHNVLDPLSPQDAATKAYTDRSYNPAIGPVFGVQTTTTGAVTAYLAPGATPTQPTQLFSVAMTRAGKCNGIYAALDVQIVGNGGTYQINVMKNGVAAGPTVTFTPASSGVTSDLAHPFTYAAGDLIEVQTVGNAAMIGAGTNLAVTLDLTAN